jgi:adenylate kinase family enzyme
MTDAQTKPEACNHVTEIGQRIQVVGNSCAGKSTAAERLGSALSIPFIDLDALNWEPGWVALTETNAEEFERRLTAATVGDAWVVAGDYRKFSQKLLWNRLETVVWLDLPVYRLLGRLARRTVGRWRSQELLWGTNTEQLWTHFKIWDKHASLLAWIVTQHRRKRRKRRRMIETMKDPRWEHIQFIRLVSESEVDTFLQSVQTSTKSDTTGKR